MLDLYPEKNVTKTILSRESNKRILSNAANGVKITIHDVDEYPDNTKNDEVLAKFSDIMGGEVRNDEGGNPF